jgi:hypothetical protein
MPKLKYKKYWIEVHNRKEKSKPKKNPKHEKKNKENQFSTHSMTMNKIFKNN